MTTPQADGGRPGASRLPAEAGLWLLVLGDLTVFLSVFLVHLGARARDEALFARSQAELVPTIGAVNTVLLLAGSLFVVRAVRAARGGDDARRRRFLRAGIACGLGFSALKVVEYAHDAHHGLSPTTNEFFTLYYVLTGLHWLHVALGLVALAVFARSRRPTEGRRLVYLEGAGVYWHMVDLLWVLIFPLVYLVR